MEYQKDRKGVAKKENALDEKEFDLDRKRDDESIIDVQSLKDPDYQVKKKEITLYDTGLIELFRAVDSSAYKELWENDGEVILTIPKNP